MKIDNIVVENTSKQLGARIIAGFKALGVDTKGLKGGLYETQDYSRTYYGVVDGGEFSHYNKEEIKDARVVTIEELESMCPLPEKWYIAITEENKDILRKWWLTLNPKSCNGCNINNPKDFHGVLCNTAFDDTYLYYGKNPSNINLGEEISFEQFKQHILKMKKEAIPQYWSIRRDASNYRVINQYMNQLFNKTNLDADNYVDRVGMVNNRNTTKGREGLPEITFSQFIEHVINKKVIGYNLREGYNEAVVRAALGLKGSFPSAFIVVGQIGYYYEGRAKELGIQDWFEPVFEEEKIVIDGHTAEKLENGDVKFGCQVIAKSTLESVKSLLNNSAFTTKLLINNVEITKEIINKLC